MDTLSNFNEMPVTTEDKGGTLNSTSLAPWLLVRRDEPTFSRDE